MIIFYFYNFFWFKFNKNIIPIRVNVMTDSKSYDDRFTSLTGLSDETWALLIKLCELTPGFQPMDEAASPQIVEDESRDSSLTH